MRKFLLLYIVTCFLKQAVSQNIYFPFYHYESESGLIHLNVLSIQTNKYGVMYFITPGGIYEYTGQTFQKKQESIPIKNIRNIFFNDTATFLVHRDKGIFILKNKKSFPVFKSNPFKRPSDKIILTSHYCYNYTDQISVEFYDYKNKIYYDDSLLLKDNSNQAYSILNITNDTLVMGRKKGLYVLYKNKITVVKPLQNYPVYSIFHLKTQHELYLGLSGKIIVVDDNTFQIKQTIPISITSPNKSGQFLLRLERNISKIIVDKYNRIWFTTQPDDNIYLLDKGKVYDVLDVLNIPPTLINDIHADNFNNIWIATFNDGVYQINSTYWQSYKITAYEKILNIKHLQASSSAVFYATNNGIFYSDTSNMDNLLSIIPPDNFFNTEIFSIQQYNQQMYSTSITAFEKETYTTNRQKITLLPFKFMAIKNKTESYISDITNNVLLYDYAKQKIKDTIYKPDDYKLNIHHLFYSTNQLLIATNKGLLIYDEIRKQFTTYLDSFQIQKIIDIDNDLYILSENKIFTYAQKKLFLDVSKYNVVTLTDLKKYQDYYFVASEEGLLVLDRNLNLFNTFGRKNGLISNVINSILIINNKLIIATDKGISYTSIDNILHHTHSYIHTPALSYIVTNNDTLLNTNNYYFTIHKDAQDIYIHIVCPNFNPLTKNKYQYSINNSDWIEFENTPLHFSSLSGGEYTIKIRATDDHIHYTDPLILTLNKELSLYEKKWFWEFIAVSSILVVTFVALLIRKREEKKSAEKLKNIQQIHLLKHQAMNAILSPHFIFNSLTGIQNYILKNDVDKASDYLSKFSRLIRMIIEKASQPNIILSEEIMRLQAYLELEQERFHNKFDFEIIIDEKIDTEKISIPNMIIQPYLENAILHGIRPKEGKGHVALIFQLLQPNTLEIIIEDDGIGIIKGEERKPKHHHSLATKTIAEILNINTQLYHKKQTVQIIDKSTIHNDQTGTIVKILIEL